MGFVIVDEIRYDSITMAIKVISRRSTRRPSFDEKIAIAEVVREILDDPDFGLELTDEARRRLRRATRDRRPGIPLEEIKRRYG